MIDFFVTKYRQLDEFVKKRRRLETGRINIQDQGFEIIPPKRNRCNASSARVNCINAFKRDLFTIDLICFELYQDELDFPMEVDEQMEGWELLLAILLQQI